VPSVAKKIALWQEKERWNMATIQIRIPDWLDKICVWPVMQCRRWKYGYSFRKIAIGEGEFTIVDQQVYYQLGHFKWSVCGDDKNIYAARILRKTQFGRIMTSFLHREIMNDPEGFFVDHRNGNGLDNRRDNLRLATRSQNSANKRKRKNTSSRFIGVHLDKPSGRWYATIKKNEKRHWIGSFVNEIDAAHAYDAAAIKYHGEFAKLNFSEEIERSPKRLNLRLANWLGARLNFPAALRRSTGDSCIGLEQGTQSQIPRSKTS